MLPGPVFNVELVTTARRARYYAARLVYGLVILFVVWQSYESQFYNRKASGEVSISAMSRFAEQIFASFAIAQSIALLVLTPTLLAGAIADETQRKTLHYLLASRLTSGEIVLGKLAARTLHILIFLAIGLPIFSLLSLLGGVDPLYVILLDLGTLCSAFFLAGLSLLISTYARRVRDAIIAVYVIEAVWLAGPPLVDALRWVVPATFFAYFAPLNDWFASIHPVWAIGEFNSPGRATLSPWARLAWYCGLQLASGAVLLFVAVLRLRPAFRKSGGEARPLAWTTRRRVRRARKRRRVGDDPMLWKETSVGRSGGMLRALFWIVGFLAAIPIGYWLVTLGLPAFLDLYRNGYGWITSSRSRQEFSDFLRGISVALAVAWWLGVAAVSAAGITSEKEEDTWISLTSSPLEGAAILGSKMLGAVWAMRKVGYAILFLWLIGLAAGAFHPFGFLAGSLQFAVSTWLVAAIGTYVSLRSRTTTRAMALTIIYLLILNVGYMVVFIPFRAESPMIAAGNMPFLLYLSQFSFNDLWDIFGFEASWGIYRRTETARMLWTLLVGFSVEVGLACLVTYRAFRGFDRVLDRPSLASGAVRPMVSKSPWVVAVDA